jgi:quercetin dioxygenase-like cupin family protein
MFVRTRKVKLMLAGVAVASAFGAVALRFAWATPGSGFAGVVVAGPVLLDEIDDKWDTDTEEIELKTRGLWESRVMSFSMAPGGHTGWHSHPGPVFVMVKKGTLTLTQADDLGNPVDYPAGTGFMEEIRRVHRAENHGDSDLEFEAFILIPAGAPVRIDEPAP